MLCLPSLLAVALLQPVAEGPPPPPVDNERPARSERAPLEAAQREADWTAKRRHLQLHTGLSGAFAGLLIVTGTLLMVAPVGCNDLNCEVNLGRLVAGLLIVVPLSLIPITTGIVCGVRLHRHDRQRPTPPLPPRADVLAPNF